MRRRYAGKRQSALLTLFHDYRGKAKKRDLEFELSFEQFMEFIEQDCWYCGIRPSQVKYYKKTYDFFLYNGIDRMDNSRGYMEGNCIPCCGRCNRMKNVLSGEDFITQIRAIAENLNL